MKQILQIARTGELQLSEVPAPAPGRGQVLVHNHYSVVSPGTDKLAMSFARKSLLQKARSRPDLVKQVLRKVKNDGPLPTYRSAMNRLDSPQPLGYSCAGVVRAVGHEVTEFVPGDRVACAGAGYANHAELVVVPENLVAPVPDGLALDRAAFATIGAIALQGLRVAQPSLGEIVAVVGLGLVGQLAVQLLIANGCRVLGIDIDERRIKEAIDLGAEWGATPDALADGWRNPATAGYGVDFAIVAASASSAAPIQLSADLCRAKGKVVVIGALPLELDRRTFYDKELELRLSMSYGPGRYDRSYEELGLDYPLPYVRWTEKRNLQAFLALAASGGIAPERLDAETLDFDDAVKTYDDLADGKRSSLAVVFRYGDQPADGRSMRLEPQGAAAGRAGSAARTGNDEIGIAFLGAGNYAKAVLLPALAGIGGLRRVGVVTATGPSAKRSAERFDFACCGTEPEEMLERSDVDLVFITTRHDLHAPLAIKALRAGKAVWLEKPLGLTPEEVEEVARAAHETGSFLAVGYNRRFSAHARAIREAFDARQGPIALHYSVAAGPVPGGTWQTDPREGGGRIIGENCHFIDLCTYLVGAPPTTVFARSMGRDPETDDSVIYTLGYADGSTATIHYLDHANAELPKERFEVSADGITATCTNYKQTQFFGGRGRTGLKRLNQDKGQKTQLAEVISALREGGASPFTLDELVGVSSATFAIHESLRKGSSVRLGDDIT